MREAKDPTLGVEGALCQVAILSVARRYQVYEQASRLRLMKLRTGKLGVRTVRFVLTL